MAGRVAYCRGRTGAGGCAGRIVVLGDVEGLLLELEGGLDEGRCEA